MNTTRIMNPQLQYQQVQANSLNATFVVEEKSDDSPQTPPKRITASPAKGVKSPAVSKRAKQKWEILERKVRKTAPYLSRKTQEQCFFRLFFSSNVGFICINFASCPVCVRMYSFTINIHTTYAT